MLSAQISGKRQANIQYNQTDRKTDMQTDRDRQTDMQTYRERQTDKQTGRLNEF